MIHCMAAESGSGSHVLSVVVCGAAPASSAGTLVGEAASRGWTVQVIATPSALPFLDLGSLTELSGSPVRSQYSKPGDPRSLLPDAIIVAPATFNTINQWALGIAGNYALGILAEQTGLEIPIVAIPFVSQALAARPPFQRSVKALRAEGVSVLLGPGGLEPHPVHTEDEHAGAFPWLTALDEVIGMTGFGLADAELAPVR
jgi:phosphopantothenoylcysteine synthetase/decarboxylase